MQNFSILTKLILHKEWFFTGEWFGVGAQSEFAFECQSVFYSFHYKLYPRLLLPPSYFGLRSHLFAMVSSFLLVTPQCCVWRNITYPFSSTLFLIHPLTIKSNRAKIEMGLNVSLQTVRPKKCTVSQMKNYKKTMIWEICNCPSNCWILEL